MPHVSLPGSERKLPRNAIPVQKRVPTERITVTLVLRQMTETVHAYRLNRKLQADLHGAADADIAAVESFAAAHGFQVDSVHQPSRTVKISGYVHDLGLAFGVQEFSMMRMPTAPKVAKPALVESYVKTHFSWPPVARPLMPPPKPPAPPADDSKAFRVRTGELHLPIELSEIVIAVLGLDERPVARTQHTQRAQTSVGPSYTPKQVAERYNFPTNVTGEGQTVAILELGGGYQNSDLLTYWHSQHVGPVSVTAIGVDGAVNAPSGNPDSADGEVCLDIEVVGAVAPSARIAVYFAPNTDQGFLAAINAAIHDTVRKPSVISISWGGPEIDWTTQALEAFNAAFHDAALLGITVCAASGDNGSSDGVADGANHVDFPASSPWVLACGGTSLTAKDETVWNDGAGAGATGGGFSTHFSKPTYFQEHIAGTGRGVPDVAGNADPETGYIVNIDGETTVIGGTSAVAPLWAAFIALMNQKLGKHMGWINQILYANPSALNDVTEGTNGAYSAGPGWDACTGLGTPNGAKLLELFLKVRG